LLLLDDAGRAISTLDRITALAIASRQQQEPNQTLHGSGDVGGAAGLREGS
jgi:hypothetical protein